MKITPPVCPKKPLMCATSALFSYSQRLSKKIKNAVTGNLARHPVTQPPNNAPIKHDVLSLGKTA
jgi:hypothetical protein